MITNLTQHAASQSQIEAGVQDLADFAQVMLNKALTFTEIPDRELLWERAKEIVALANACNNKEVMLGGAPFFMSVLEAELQEAGFTPMYAFSQRVSEEKTQDDGSVVKINVFKHLGFVST